MSSISSAIKRCIACILPVGFPGLTFNSEGVCSLCSKHSPLPPPLGEEALLKAIKASVGKDYDCLVPLSGGKDSSYVLYYAVKRLKLRVLAVNYNSGFQSPIATENVIKACEALNVPLKVFHANMDLRLALVRQVVRIASLTGAPTGVCGNCENAIRQYSIRAAREEGVSSILLGDSEAEKISMPISTGISRIIRRTSVNNLLGLLKTISTYYLIASREKKYMGISTRDALRPTMAPIPFPEPEIQAVHFFDYIPWETMHKKELLAKELGWKATGNRMDRFDCFLHPLDNLAFLKETGISKDGFVYANLVREGIISREQALLQEMNIEKNIRNDCMIFLNRYPLESSGTGWID